MKKLRMKRIADNLYQIDPPVVLEEKEKTRRLFLGELAHSEHGEWCVRGTFIVERKGPNGWNQLESIKLSTLKASEMAKLELRSEHVRRLYAGLSILVQAAEEQGVNLRPTNLIVGKENEVVRVVEQEHKAVLEQLIAQNRSRDFWDALSRTQPDLAAQIADADLQRRRKAALATFEEELTNKQWKEPQWEKFFVQNTWIFGYGLRYQFLSVLQNQANYGGSDFTRKGEQKGEFLMATAAQERFTVVVEIKRPDSPIFEQESYRRGVPAFSREFVNAISQANVNAHTWEVEGSRRDSDREKLGREGIHTITPRAILVYGHTGELSHHEHQRAFCLYRGNLHSPDIITFDELLERARFIVSEADSSTERV